MTPGVYVRVLRGHAEGVVGVIESVRPRGQLEVWWFGGLEVVSAADCEVVS